jgi:hypothetical protein
MKILCTMSEDQFNSIEKYIECHDWANPIEDHYVFYEPTSQFLFIMALFNIQVYKDT